MNTLNVYQGPDGEFTFLPYHLPEGSNDGAKVERIIEKKGSKITVVSMRNAIFMGLKPTNVILDRDVVVHRLSEHDADGEVGCWMTSYPQEIEQHERQLAEFSGDVLIGGLGLGLAIALLQKNPRVRRMFVIEQDTSVIDLVWPWLSHKNAFIIRDDLFHYLRKQRGYRNSRNTFDYAFFDIWRPTSQHVITTHIKPLRMLSIGLVDQSHIECWNEQEMLGQVRMQLAHRINIELAPEETSFAKFKMANTTDEQFNACRNAEQEVWPFFNWVRKTQPTVERMQRAVDAYMAALQDATLWKERWARYEHV